jgi:FdhD protein
MSDALSPRRAVRIVRVTASGAQNLDDVAAVEEPLEVRLHDRPFAVIMRTPGEDRQLTAGFLLAEGVISNADDLGAVEHCRHPDHPKVHNVVNVFLLGPAAARLAEMLEGRRNVLSTSSCGICGRVTIESLQTRATPLQIAATMSTAILQELPSQLRARQPLFDQTGALHAAALFTMEGECMAIAEDVGRHNAVDKVVGQMLLEERLPLTDHVLVVSGRASYEIVQKAWLGGVGMICSVSAPSSLAIDLAQEAGITLVGFARSAGFNVYSHAARLELR